MEKKCRICKVPKALQLFPKNATANDGRYHICKECMKNVENPKRRQRRKEVADFYKMFL